MPHERNQQSDVLLRTHAFEPPPPDWYPAHAADNTLRRHGYPRRPDPRVEPRFARLWNDAAVRNPRMIKAKLAIDPIMSRRDPLRRPGVDLAPSGWAGVVVQPASLSLSPPEPAIAVFGKWQIPGIWPVADPKSDLIAGFWVGLDGWKSNQVLQAGVAVTVSPSAQVTWWAWTEWYTTQFKDPAVAVQNFPVAPGDLVGVLVCAPTSTQGFVAINNFTANVTTTVGIEARPGISLAGSSVEWIVEGVSPELPVFCPVTFTECSAGTKDHEFDLLPAGFTTEMAGASAVLTASSIVSATSAVVDWEGLS